MWIPVASEEELTRTAFDTTTGQPIAGLGTNYTEPFASGYVTEITEFNTMKAQTLLYGGFYIGRYEAGDGTNGTTLRTAATTEHTVVSKKGVAPYNYVPWGTSMSDASEIAGRSSAVYLSKKMYETSNSVTSTLCYSSQWDAMCRYIGDSQRTTPTKSAAELTGNIETDVSKNIYDLAGNCSEWTMEADDTKFRVNRGGLCSYALPICNRNSYVPTLTINYISFRSTLYIK